MPFDVGQTVSDYEILDIIGKGGMGRVYRVRNVISGRVEAMKVLLSDIAGEQEIGERFGGEIRTLGRLDHPNIAKLHTALRVGNELVMLMEFVEGITLTDRVRQGPLPLDELLNYASQTLCALSYAHQNGVVHRDIKPSNIMVTPQGVVKLMDFGIAKSQNDNMNTRTGMTMGSVLYMSPEQVRGTGVDARSDLYSMGIVLYELSAGRRPFESDSTYTVLDAQLNSVPQPPIEHNPAIPQALNEIILRALEKDPANRFQTADEFLRALEPLTSGLDRPMTQFATVVAAYRPVTPPNGIPVAPPEAVMDVPAASSGSITKWVTAAIALMVVALIAGGIYLVLNKKPGAGATAATTQATATQPKAALAPLAELHTSTGDMVLVKGGDAHLGEQATAQPIRTFYIDKTEVSLGAYREFCRAKSIKPPERTQTLPDDMPVVNVTLDEAKQFAAWADKRLPTAQEWETAARGLNGQTYPWGNTFEASRANLKGGPGHLTSVTSYVPGASPAGALNMLGNVWEIVDTPTNAPPPEYFQAFSKDFAHLDPPLSRDELYYQARGGSYLTNVNSKTLPTLVWDNSPFPARARKPDVGFRCAKDVPQ